MVRPADNVQLKAATSLPLVGLARSKQNPIQKWAWCSVFMPPPASQGQCRISTRKEVDIKTVQAPRREKGLLRGSYTMCAVYKTPLVEDSSFNATLKESRQLREG